jgi:hypothetical protein
MVCNVCGRQVEEAYPGSGQAMPCICVTRRLPSLEVDPNGTCPKCGANAALEGYCEECER